MAIAVTDNPDRSRFDITADGEHVGHSVYRRRGTDYVFTHTEIDDDREGEGLGSTLVRGALDEIRRRGARVVPECRFVRSFIEDNQEYADLVA